MASPQKENGFTSLANELLEALTATRVPGEAMQVLLAIMRKTYGFQKKSDTIALSQLCLLTKMNRGNVCRGIRKLTAMNMITSVKGDTTKYTRYSINKDFTTWKTVSKLTLVSNLLSASVKDAHRGVSEVTHSKETNTKDTISKEKTEPSADALRLASHFYNGLKQIHPGFREPNLTAWAKQLDALMRDRQDDFDGKFSELQFVLDWCHSNAYWRKVIFSPKHLRDNFDMIAVQIKG